MMKDFIAGIGDRFRQEGLLVEIDPPIPGLRSLLYARTPGPRRVAFAKVEDHFLFLDWENDLFARLDRLLEAHKEFSSFVNRRYKTPHAWRMTIPNLVTAAVSTTEFPAAAIACAQNRYLNHWAGGETGQLMLIKLPEKLFIHHIPPQRMDRQTGSLPLVNAVNFMNKILIGEP